MTKNASTETIHKRTLELWGQNIRSKRKEYKWTVDQLAELVGVNRSNIVRWESGATEPSIPHRIIVATCLDVPPEELFEYPSL